MSLTAGTETESSTFATENGVRNNSRWVVSVADVLDSVSVSTFSAVSDTWQIIFISADCPVFYHRYHQKPMDLSHSILLLTYILRQLQFFNKIWHGGWLTHYLRARRAFSVTSSVPAQLLRLGHKSAFEIQLPELGVQMELHVLLEFLYWSRTLSKMHDRELCTQTRLY